MNYWLERKVFIEKMNKEIQRIYENCPTCSTSCKNEIENHLNAIKWRKQLNVE